MESMSLRGRKCLDTYIAFIVILVYCAHTVTANINYAAVRHDEQPLGREPKQARTTREILEAFDKWAIDRPTYTLQQATEHILQYGALLRIEILDTFGALVYDHYDDYSIGQTEALYRVYRETLERKYNIFDIVPSVLANPDTRPTKICRHIKKHVRACLKESSAVCSGIRKHDRPHPRTSWEPVVNVTRRVYKSARIKEHFPDGFSLPAVLKHLKAGTLQLTVGLLSGLLHNVQYDSFDHQVRTAERNALIILGSETSDAGQRPRVLAERGLVRRVHTVAELLRELFERRKVMYDGEKNKNFAVLSEHVVREVEAISRDIEVLGTIYENNTIDMDYLLNLVLPADVVDSDITEAKDYLLRKMNDYDIIRKHLKVEKYQQSGPDQLLMQILGQMRDVNFAVDLVTALHAHARFWHRSHMIRNLNELLELFDAYENLRNVPEYDGLMSLIDDIRGSLWDSANVTVEILCNNPRACLRLGLETVARCVLVNTETRNRVASLFLRLSKTGSVGYTGCYVPMNRTAVEMTDFTEKLQTTQIPTTLSEQFITGLSTRKRLQIATESTTIGTTGARSAEGTMPTTDNGDDDDDDDDDDHDWTTIELGTEAAIATGSATATTTTTTTTTTDTPTALPSTAYTKTERATTEYETETTERQTTVLTIGERSATQPTTEVTELIQTEREITTEEESSTELTSTVRLTTAIRTTLEPTTDEPTTTTSTTQEAMTTERKTIDYNGTTAPMPMPTTTTTTTTTTMTTTTTTGRTVAANATTAELTTDDDCYGDGCTAAVSNESTDTLPGNMNWTSPPTPILSENLQTAGIFPPISSITATVAGKTEDPGLSSIATAFDVGAASSGRMTTIGKNPDLPKKPKPHSASVSGEDDCSGDGCPSRSSPEETGTNGTGCNSEGSCPPSPIGDTCDDYPDCNRDTGEQQSSDDCSGVGCPLSATSREAGRCVGNGCTEVPPDCLHGDCSEQPSSNSNESACTGHGACRSATATTRRALSTTATPVSRCDNKDPRHQRKLHRLRKIRIINAVHATAPAPADSLGGYYSSNESNSASSRFVNPSTKHANSPQLGLPRENIPKRPFPWHPILPQNVTGQRIGQHSAADEVTRNTNLNFINTRRYIGGSLGDVTTPASQALRKLSPANGGHRRGAATRVSRGPGSRRRQDTGVNLLKLDLPDEMNSNISRRPVVSSTRINPVVYQSHSDDNTELARKNRSIIRAPRKANRRYRAL